MSIESSWLKHKLFFWHINVKSEATDLVGCASSACLTDFFDNFARIGSSVI